MRRGHFLVTGLVGRTKSGIVRVNRQIIVKISRLHFNATTVGAGAFQLPLHRTAQVALNMIGVQAFNVRGSRVLAVQITP